MPQSRSRGEKVRIGSLIVWMVFWTSAILVAIWSIGSTAWNGEAGAMAFLAIWVAAAGFGLWSAGRRLATLLLVGTPPPPPHGNHRWDDGIDPPR